MVTLIDHQPPVFTMRHYVSMVYAMALYPSVSVSVTSRCSTKIAKHRITQTKPHDSPGTLVSVAKHLTEISPGSPAAAVPNAGGVG